MYTSDNVRLSPQY